MGLGNLPTRLKEAWVTDAEEFRRLIHEYLKPTGGLARRAHLFTINGLTYPAHKTFCFAAVPDPHELTKQGNKWRINTQRSKRRYSMLAYLYSVREGDLIFFFQADPQWPRDIFNRRGFRGIWTVKSAPFRDSTNIKLPSGYEILGACPVCSTPFNFGGNDLERGKRCPLCGGKYGLVDIEAPSGTKKFSRVVLSARLLIEPLIIFRKTAGDNRVYGDMSVEPLIWVSRADNAMGPGKGSSIRTLLPEEASKIACMLASEDSQEIDEDVCKGKYPGSTTEPIKDHNGVEVVYPRVRASGWRWIVEHELHLNLFFSLRMEDLLNLLGVPSNEVDYWSTEFPWGYTGDTSDFVLSCWDEEKGRYRVYLFEFKKGRIDKGALTETLLYVPWVVQVMTQSMHETTAVEVVPVIVGRRLEISSLPADYSFELKSFISRRSRHVVVKTPLILEYEPVDVFKVQDAYLGADQYYASDLVLDTRTLPTRSISPPPQTYTTTEVEKRFVEEKYLRPL